MATQAPEIDGVTLINDFEGAAPRAGEIRRCASPKRTITTWWARCSPPPSRAPRAGGIRTWSTGAMKCPICKKEVPPGDPEFPFCSERCRMIDLGNWATEKYVILRRRPTPTRGSRHGRR